MPLSTSDLKWYGSESMPEDDVTIAGGDIDLTTKVIFTDISTTDNITVISDSAGDTGDIVITGRLSSGIIDTETLTLNGTTRVVGSKLFERILKITVDADTDGTVTITRDNTPTYTVIATIEVGIRKVVRLFYDAAGDAAGGSTRNFYQKIFLKNEHGSIALTNARIAESADPTTFITFDLESAKDSDNSTVDSRLDQAPASGMLSSFSNSTKNIPGTYLGAGEYIGVWLKMAVPAGTSPTKNTYSLRTTGKSV